MGKPFHTYKQVKGHYYKYEVTVTERCLGRVSDEEALSHRERQKIKPRGNIFGKATGYKPKVIPDNARALSTIIPESKPTIAESKPAIPEPREQGIKESGKQGDKESPEPYKEVGREVPKEVKELYKRCMMRGVMFRFKTLCVNMGYSESQADEWRKMLGR